MALKAFADGALFGNVRLAEPFQVLALHGWGRTHADFDVVLADVPSISLDLPGFGASPVPSGIWGADEYADLVLTVLESFPNPPLIIGHSFGGRVAVSLAARYPDLVGGLLLIGVPLLRPPDRPPSKPSFLYRIIRGLHGRGLMSETRMEWARQKYGSADYRATQGTMREILVKVVNETYEQHLSAIRGRVHLLWGSEDTAAPVSIARTAVKQMSQAEVSMAILPGVGHDVMAENPEKVRSEIAMLIEAL